jgi:hypothetical protein
VSGFGGVGLRADLGFWDMGGGMVEDEKVGSDGAEIGVDIG